MHHDLYVLDPRDVEQRPSYYAVDDLIKEFISQGAKCVPRSAVSARLLNRLAVSRRRTGSNKSILFVPMMGPRSDWLDHNVLWSAYNVIFYCWDVWPSNESAWEKIFRRARPSLVFMSSRDACSAWRQRTSFSVKWAAEAVAEDSFNPGKALADRVIDVLELGRQWTEVHKELEGLSSRGSVKHLFERQKGDLIFPDRPSLVAGLGNTKLVVCVPGSVTHPGRCGLYETVTQRYFEAMAAGALPVGRAPTELIELFGYNPVIELNPVDAATVVLDVLSNIAAFNELALKNLKRVREVASWRTRVAQIFQCAERSIT